MIGKGRRFVPYYFLSSVMYISTRSVGPLLCKSKVPPAVIVRYGREKVCIGGRTSLNVYVALPDTLPPIEISPSFSVVKAWCRVGH